MTKAARLAYHRKHSRPLIDELHAYLNHLIDERLAEPNDSLGKAINYTLKHWHELSQFLRIEGAPLDNNAMEQGLKIPIRGRKNWLFYKNSYVAHIGGVITSVLYTAMLSGINPQHYLVTLQEHKEQVVQEPQNFLPWNYQQTLSAPLAAAA